MFGIIASALNVALGFVLRTVVVKFVTFFALFFVTTGFVEVLHSSGLLPSASGIRSAFAGAGPGLAFFFQLLALDVGLPMILSAWATRFIIRRLPVIG